MAHALAQVGDVSQVHNLLDQAEAGDEAAFSLLAAMLVEDALVSTDQIPASAPVASGTTCIWHALILARLGDYGPLDTILSGEEPEPELFRDSPWTAFDAPAELSVDDAAAIEAGPYPSGDRKLTIDPGNVEYECDDDFAHTTASAESPDPQPDIPGATE